MLWVTPGALQDHLIFFSPFSPHLYMHTYKQDHPMSEVGEVVAGQEKGQLKIFKPLFA